MGGTSSSQSRKVNPVANSTASSVRSKPERSFALSEKSADEPAASTLPSGIAVTRRFAWYGRLSTRTNRTRRFRFLRSAKRATAKPENAAGRSPSSSPTRRAAGAATAPRGATSSVKRESPTDAASTLSSSTQPLALHATSSARSHTNVN